MGDFFKKILELYNNFMIKLLKIKYFCINRTKFLNRQQKISGGKVDAGYVRRRIRRLIFYATSTTGLLTFLATIPTAVWISIPLAVLDFLQFQVFLYIIQQQMMYLHGSKDLRNIRGSIDYENGSYLMWLETNVMLGVKDSMKSKLKSAGGFVVRKSISLIIAKSPFRLILITGIRQFLKWCGVLVTHELVMSSLELVVAVLCAIVAAGVSIWQFLPMCRRFAAKLDSNGLEVYEDAFFHDDNEHDDATDDE